MRDRCRVDKKEITGEIQSFVRLIHGEFLAFRGQNCKNLPIYDDIFLRQILVKFQICDKMRGRQGVPVDMRRDGE